MSKYSLNTALDILTSKVDYSSIYYLDESDSQNIEKRTEEYLDFMMHCMIIVKKRNNVISYELSLVGIMLVLALVRLSEMDSNELSNHFGISSTHSIKLFCPLPIQDYYDKISAVHEEKLPLIFGIWPSLKRTLGTNLVYSLDPIIDKKSRSKVLDLPLLLGGISEIYHDVKTIVILEQIKLRDIYDEGIKQLGRIYNKGDNELVKRLDPLLQKFKQIELLMKFAFLSSFLDSLQNENYSSNYNRQQIYDNHANFITSSLKQEIPLLYYLILGKSSNELSLPLISNLPASEFIPKESLDKIVKEHSVVKDMLNPWIEEIREYHDRSLVLVDNFLERKEKV